MARTNDRYEYLHCLPASGSGGSALVVPMNRAASPSRSLGRVAAALVPALVIAALLYAGLFIKPSPTGQAVPTPPIERRDAFFGLDLPAPGVIWAAGSRGKIVRSDDGGKTWTVQPTPTVEHLQDLAAWNGRQAVVVGNQGVVLRTDDGGLHWSVVPAPRSEIANKLLRVVALQRGRALAVGEMGALLESEDFGRSWRRLVAERDVGFNAVALAGDTLWVAGEAGTLMRSNDGGKVWHTANVPVSASLTGVAFRDALHGAVVGLEGTVLITDDGGMSWIDHSVKAAGHLYDIAVDGDGWRAVGMRDVLLRGVPDGSKWAIERATGRSLAWHSKLVEGGGRWLYAGPGLSLVAQTAHAMAPRSGGGS
ncbi:glycosyl hydrolase [Azoarcus sp. L1K30]|uniref:WD40/YVTN/BNR-like repeat-containing protein n=1 Tax=Azoarcus sp. L1K30 TaxID=2820277 RepID=UPI001B829AB5|nr:YCF48-related protein [Azoarcus sp. L1K30]MBR0567507.1 glycosyl hydrolase [Azoarcus sp. L1K30]